MIVVAVFISGIFSILLSNLVIAPKSAFQQKASTVDPISTEFTQPDTKYFNKDSVNPTKKITIGDNSNDKPFNAQQ